MSAEMTQKTDKPMEGKPCPNCGGFIGFYGTIVDGVHTTHYWCEDCHSRWALIEEWHVK